jgi:hypothetical protein
MSNEQGLVLPPNGWSALETASLGLPSLTILNELYMCAADAKTEPDERLHREFLREFTGEKPEILQWAFREHRRRSKFFPAVSEIHELVMQRRREEWEAAQFERGRLERVETEKARAEGKTVSFAEIVEMVRTTIKRMPDTPALARWHQRRKDYGRSYASPAIIATPEEIRASVERERNDPKCQAELEHYREMYGG